MKVVSARAGPRVRLNLKVRTRHCPQETVCRTGGMVLSHQQLGRMLNKMGIDRGFKARV